MRKMKLPMRFRILWGWLKSFRGMGWLFMQKVVHL